MPDGPQVPWEFWGIRSYHRGHIGPSLVLSSAPSLRRPNTASPFTLRLTSDSRSARVSGKLALPRLPSVIDALRHLRRIHQRRRLLCRCLLGSTRSPLLVGGSHHGVVVGVPPRVFFLHWREILAMGIRQWREINYWRWFPAFTPPSTPPTPSVVSATSHYSRSS